MTEPSPNIPPTPTLSQESRLLGVGWLVSNLGFWIPKLPRTLLLKEVLGLNSTQVSAFDALINIPNYLKPLAGLISDSAPIFGTRRKHYLVISLLIATVLWLVVGFTPRVYGQLAASFLVLYIFIVCISTVLGGLMVDVGKRHHASGRLSAQRIGLVKLALVCSALIGGYLAKVDFLVTALICAGLHLALAPIFWFLHHEERIEKIDTTALTNAKRQLVTIFKAPTLWAAAGLVMLVIAAPGFNTLLTFHQRDVLKFDPLFIGTLEAISNAFAVLAAVLYSRACRKLDLRRILALSIVVHAASTLVYLAYRTPASAIAITALEGLAQTLAILPLYDLAIRATPRGCEALGYSVMMSVWNLTEKLSDLFGSWMHDRFGMDFYHLVYINAGSSALVLLAVPFLPAALMNRREGTLDKSIDANC